jgi:hypothetical protein
MKLATFTVVAGICLGGTLATAADGPARFWITASKIQPFVNAPTIEAPIGVERTLYIWGRPATNGDGSFKTLQNFSLNLVVPAARLLINPMDLMSAPVDPVVDFLDHRIVVHNPEFVPGQKRFQFAYDSTHGPPEDNRTLVSNASPVQVSSSDCTPPEIGACTPDGIGTVFNVESGDDSGGDIQGFSFPVPIDGITGVGIAPGECAAFEFCPVNESSPAAWLIAEVGFKTVRPSGINPYFLQIGRSGMNHRNETSDETYVMFSPSGDSPEFKYHASVFALPSDLQNTHENENPHVLIRALPANEPGDYDRNGIVNAADYDLWRQSFGQLVVPPGTGADGSGNGTIDAADYVVWRDRRGISAGGGALIGGGSTSTGSVSAPEPSSSILSFGLLFLFLTRDLLRPAILRGSKAQVL